MSNNHSSQCAPRMALNDFFVTVQAKALKQTIVAVHNKDDAMDIVQDAMIKLAKNYSEKQNDWPKLFQRILQNTIRDYFRRKKVRSIIVWWNQHQDDHENDIDELDNLQASSVGSVIEPENQHQSQQTIEEIHAAVSKLPLRQQQAFLLRAWWGHDVEETAFAMSCSAGSVKTHYSRAINKLKECLGEFSYEPQ